MIENWITHERITQGEPALADYLRSDQSSFDDIIDEAYDEYLCDMKDRGIDLRRLGLRLTLPIDETVSAEDTIERRRIVLTVDGAYEFTLQGCNTSDGTFVDIRDIATTEAGQTSYLITDTYKYYILNKTSGSGTYSAYMYETTFDYPLLFLMRSKIYFSIYHRNSNDAFLEKAKNYREQYLTKIDNIPATRYYYDYDDDGSVDEYEAEKPSIHQITIRP